MDEELAEDGRGSRGKRKRITRKKKEIITVRGHQRSKIKMTDDHEEDGRLKRGR